ncbi:hypothetical protein ABEF95_008277 [Exophiala dermatitidis]
MMHPPKRRRLDGSPAFQNKPFRSPLKRADIREAEPHGNLNERAEPERRLTSAPTSSIDTSGISPRRLSSSSSTLESTVVPAAANQDLRKEHSALSRQLAQLRQSLDTAKQALDIETSNQDVELRRLIAKWRAVAQEAAEELFVDAKERVQAMGGVHAWQRRNEQDARLWNDNGPEQPGGQCDDPARHSPLAGNDDLDVSNDLDEDEGEASFNMEMMLRQMNVDPRVIGYDEGLERWVE